MSLTASSSKTEVVSVRVAPRIKAALQRMADKEMRSQANMIEVMVVAYCNSHGVELGDESKPSTVSAKIKAGK